MGLSRQKYWSGLPFSSPGDLPDPRIEPATRKYFDILLLHSWHHKCGFSTHQAVLRHYLPQFWHYLPRDSIRYYRWRGQPHRTTPSTTTLFRCQLQVQVVTCASDQLQIRGYTTTSQVPLIARVAYRTQENSFSSVTQSCPTLCDPMDYSIAGFSITNSQSLLKLMSIKLVMPSNHLILCHPPLLLQLSIFPSIRVFSN